MTISSFTELEGAGHPRRWLVLAVLAAVGFMAQLDLFIVNLAVPAMAVSFPDAGLEGLSWVLTAYAVVFGGLLVPAGRWADRYGRRRFLLGGVAVFALASAVCAVAPSLPILIAGRALQAAGAAAILPTSLSLLYPAFPPRLHATVVGIWAGVAAVAATAGPALGGVLVALDWRWIFVVNVPIAAAVLACGAVLPADGRSADTAPPPRAGSVLTLLAAVALVVLLTVELPGTGWTPATILLAVAAALAVTVSVVSTVRLPRAVVPRDLFAGPGFGVAAVALTLFFVAFAAWLLVGVLFLQNAWGYSALDAGLALAPGPFAAAVVALGSGRIVRRFGPRVPAITGPLCVTAAGLYWFWCAPAAPDYLGGFVIGQVVGGIGSGLTQAPLFAVTAALPAASVTAGTAFLNMCRQVGSAFGVALLVVVMTVPAATALAPYRHGWLLVAGAAALAALVQLRPARLRSAGRDPISPAHRPARTEGP